MTHIALGWIVGLVLLGGCSDSDRDMPQAVPEMPQAVASPAAPRASAQAPQPPSPKEPPPAVKTADGQPVNAVGAATKQFLDRIQAYVDFHNGVEKTVPPLRETPKPEEIAAREKALAEALIKARPNPKEGDFFIESYRPILLRIIREDFAKRSAADRKALIVELPKGVKVGVNQVYPTTLPLATFPGNLLKALPELPDIFEYRIVGRDLILLDVKGDVVVDVVRNAFTIPS